MTLHSMQVFAKTLQEEETLKPGQLRRLNRLIEDLEAAQTQQEVESALGDLAQLFILTRSEEQGDKS